MGDDHRASAAEFVSCCFSLNPILEKCANYEKICKDAGRKWEKSHNMPPCHKPNTAGGTQGVSHGRRSDSGDSVHVAAGKSLGTSGSRGGQVATGTFSLGVDYIDIV
jgi:hypothetical protein